MLNLDISQLSDEEVTKVVTSETASFGTVKRVGIHRTADPTGNQFALIDMSSPEEANRVLSGLGDAMLGGSVVIRFIPHNTTQQPSAAGMPRVDFRKSFEGQLSRLDEPLMKEFTRHFSEDIEKFVSGITSAAYTWLGFHRTKGDRRDLDAASLFLFNAINQLVISMRLFLSGYIVPSGNLCRNVLESIAIASLISEPKTGCFERLERKEEFAPKAVYWMHRNADVLGYKPEGIQDLITYYKFFHHYSHPSMASLSSILTGEQGPLVLGALFAADRLDEYKKEMEVRIDLATLIANTVGVIHILQCGDTE